MQKEELIKFEEWVVETFNDGKLKSPVHLDGSKDGSQEDKLIEIFKDIKPNDWVFSNYRSHYHSLLKGMPEERLKQWILDNKSIHVMDKEHKIFTSAIVGGCLSIALGTALSIKMNSKKMKSKLDNTISVEIEGYKEVTDGWTMNEPKVYCFVGDMTANTGNFREVFRYAVNHKLPIKFIIANNFLSTDTDCADVWGVTRNHYEWQFDMLKATYPEYFDYYNYERKYPHYGTGKFITKIWDDMDKDDVKGKGF